MVKNTVRFVRRKMGVSDWFAPVLFFTVLGMLVLGPAMKSGYIFLLDMPWPKQFQLSDFTNGSPAVLPMGVFLTVANKIFAAWLLQKIILVSVFTIAGFGMYRLHRHFKVPRSRRYAASFLYAFNPFVLERLAAGQWLVLLGYALLPFFVSRLIKFGHEQNRKNTTRLALWYALYPVVSVHWWYIITLFVTPLAAYWLYRRFKQTRTRGARLDLLYRSIAVVFLVAVLNARWAWSALSESSMFNSISVADFNAFQTSGNGWFGAIGNVVSLYGFWQRIYVMPADDGMGAWMLPIILIILTALGARRLYKKHGALWLYPLVLLPIAIVLAAGFGSPLTTPITSVFIRIIPGYVGMRDTAKFVGVIAFIYAFYAPSGLAVIGAELKKIWTILGGRRQVSAGFMIMYVVMMAGGLWGMGGQLNAYQYPKGWAEAETFLHVQNAQKIMILPWRGYLNLHFANDSFVANPARLYFSAEVVQGKGVNNILLDEKRQKTEFDILAKELLHGNASAALESIRQKDVQFIVILKTADWQAYATRLERIVPAYDDADIAVYPVATADKLLQAEEK